MPAHDELIRKQYLIYPGQIEKVAVLAKELNTSATEIVRLAIDAYDPRSTHNMSESDLMGLVSDKLKEALTSTRHANREVAKTLKVLDKRDA